MTEPTTVTVPPTKTRRQKATAILTSPKTIGIGAVIIIAGTALIINDALGGRNKADMVKVETTKTEKPAKA